MIDMVLNRRLKWLFLYLSNKYYITEWHINLPSKTQSIPKNVHCTFRKMYIRKMYIDKSFFWKGIHIEWHVYSVVLWIVKKLLLFLLWNYFGYLERWFWNRVLFFFFKENIATSMLWFTLISNLGIHCVKYAKYGFSLTWIFPYKNRIK